MNFIVIGIVVTIFIALAVYLYWDHNKSSQKIKQGVETKGKVIDVVSISKHSSGLIQKLSENSEDGAQLYYPVVRFVLEGAKGVKFRDKKGFEEKDIPFAIGQEINIIYDKTNPLVAEIKY